jgi:hypothetical protein
MVPATTGGASTILKGILAIQQKAELQNLT